MGNSGLVLEYSFWFIPLCILLGTAYAFILYYKERKNEYSQSLRWILAIFRTVAISVIAFLLLNPMIRLVSKESQKPLVILAVDNSSSVVAGKDSVYYRQDFPDILNEVSTDLAGDFDLVTYSFGGEISNGNAFTYDQPVTDISELLQTLENDLQHRNVGALILASDGIYNRGLNPLFIANKFNYPIYTVALGDTIPHRDVIIDKISHNEIAFYENTFPVEVDVHAIKFNGEKLEISIEKDGKVIEKQNLTVSGDDSFTKLKFTLKADEIGLQRYSAFIKPLSDEINLLNNKQDFFVDVLEDKQKVLILAASPHPDVTAIKSALLKNKNYEVDFKMASDFNESIEPYSLIALHGLPSSEFKLGGLTSSNKTNEIPVLLIASGQTDRFQLDRFNTGLVDPTADLPVNDAYPLINPLFQGFTIKPKTAELLEDFPPLQTLFASSEVLPSAKVFLYQNISGIGTKRPMMIVNEVAGKKTGILLGNGIWRWRLKNYSMTQNHQAFDEIITKMVQFLVLKQDKSLFRINSKNIFEEGDRIQLEAQLYNDIYELINEPEVELTLTDENANNRVFRFTQTNNAYFLDLGMLPPGEYNYNATVSSGSRVLSESGVFLVRATNLEGIQTVANHNLLFNLAQRTGGEMLYPGQAYNIPDLLDSRGDIASIIYTTKKYNKLQNHLWILLMILSVLSLEWFLRKRFGGY